MIPMECLPEDNQTITRKGIIYDVYRLIHEAAHIEPISMRVSVLRQMLPSGKRWIDNVYAPLSPQEFLEEYQHLGSWDLLLEKRPKWSEHIARMQDADYSYPILVHECIVADGAHRILRAEIDGVKVLPVKILKELPARARYVFPLAA